MDGAELCGEDEARGRVAAVTPGMWQMQVVGDMGPETSHSGFCVSRLFQERLAAFPLLKVCHQTDVKGQRCHGLCRLAFLKATDRPQEMPPLGLESAGAGIN